MTAYVIARPAAPKRLFASALGLALLPPAAPANDESATEPDPQQATRLESLEVKATTLATSSPKFTAPLLDTPRAVTVIPQEILRETAASSLLDALRSVPGITFGAGEGGNPNGDRPFIRGFDTESSLFVDGVRSSGSQQREVFDVEQIEVIKGPSSAYSGRGAVGGSINLVSKTPRDRDTLDADLGLGTSTYSRATADWNQTLPNDAAFRLNVLGHKNDVPDRGGPVQRRWGVAPSLTFGLHAATSLTLSYYHLQSNDLPDSGIPYGNPNNAPWREGKPIHVPHDTFYGLFSRDFQRRKDDIGDVQLKHDFGNGWQLRNLSVYARAADDYLWTQPDDSNGNFIVNGGIWRRANSRQSVTRNATNQTDLSGVFTTGPIEHSLAAGVELAHESTDRSNYNVGVPTTPGATYHTGNIANGACSPRYGIGAPSHYWCAPVIDPDPRDPWTGAIVGGVNPATIATQTRSAWVFDTLTFGPRWQANLGARFDHFATVSDALTSATGVKTHLRNDADFWNYQAGLVYKPVPAGSLYLSYGTSSNPPGVDAGDGADGIAVTNADLKPESSRNLETGLKWELRPGLMLSSAVFRTEKRNARVALGGRGSPQVNAGTQRVDGVELELSGQLTERWGVFGGYTYLKSKLVDPGPGDAASKGNAFPNTPRQSASVWTDYQLTARLRLGGGLYAMDRVYGNTANTKYVPGYLRVDAMAAYVVNADLTVQLNVQNLTNRYYFDKAYAAHYASVAPGRVAIVNFHFSF